MQDATGHGPLLARTRLAKQAIRMEKVGAVVMLAAPVVMVLAATPHVFVIEVFIGVMIFASTILLHAVTRLPVELDASFRRALPVLKAGRLRAPSICRRPSRSCSAPPPSPMSAAAAMSLLDAARWLRVLRM